MARKMPELRSTFLYRRVFLNQRSARFDLAMLALTDHPIVVDKGIDRGTY